MSGGDDSFALAMDCCRTYLSSEGRVKHYKRKAAEHLENAIEAGGHHTTPDEVRLAASVDSIDLNSPVVRLDLSALAVECIFSTSKQTIVEKICALLAAGLHTEVVRGFCEHVVRTTDKKDVDIEWEINGFEDNSYSNIDIVNDWFTSGVRPITNEIYAVLLPVILDAASEASKSAGDSYQKCKIRDAVIACSLLAGVEPPEIPGFREAHANIIAAREALSRAEKALKDILEV